MSDEEPEHRSSIAHLATVSSIVLMCVHVCMYVHILYICMLNVHNTVNTYACEDLCIRMLCILNHNGYNSNHMET